MNREEQARAAWYEAHTVLREFLEPLTGMDKARELASKACGYWLQAAADGMVTPYGPYAQLYAAAIHAVQQECGVLLMATIGTLERAVPVSQTLLPYQLSKIYTDVWKAAQFLAWDRKIIHRAAKGVAQSYPDSPTTWAPLGIDWIGPLVLPLGRCAVEVLSTHECLECEICAQAAVRWEDDDSRTEKWNTNQRLARLEP